MEASPTDLDEALEVVADLEDFIHDLLSKVVAEELEDGDDLAEHAARLGVRIPASLEGEEIRYSPDAGGDTGGRSLVLIRPGQPDALDFKVGCSRSVATGSASNAAGSGAGS